MKTLKNNKLNKKLSYLFFFAFIIIYNIFLVDAPSPFLSENDSLWFIEKSNTILSGEWLGEYNRMTLIKNPLYPIYLAIISFFGVEYCLLTTILYQVSILFFISSLNIKNYSLKILFFISIFFYPEYFTTYKATVIREDLEIIFLLIFSGAMGYLINRKKSEAIFLASFIASIAIINKDSGTAWMATFACSITFFILINFNKISKRKIFLYVLLSISIYKAPTLIVKSLNRTYYQFNGSNIFFSSKFSEVYGKLISIRSKEYKPTTLRNPLDNSTIDKILSLPNHNDVQGVLNILQKKYIWYKEQSTSLPNWGSGLMWGLLYSFLDYYDSEYHTLKNGKNINKAAEKFLRDVKEICDSNKKTINCSTFGRGYLQSPNLWSSNHPVFELFFNLPDYFLKYFYWTLGEKSNPLTLSPRNDDIHWVNEREDEAIFLLNQLNYSEASYLKKRLNSDKLKALQIFSYIIRYASFFFLIYFIIIGFKNKKYNLFKTINLYQFPLFLIIIFTLQNVTYYLFYLLLLKRGYKYIVITGVMIVPIIISIYDKANSLRRSS